ARVPLTVNCRNTLNILDTVKQRLGADMGVRGAGKGPAVREYTAASPVEAFERLAQEIRDLMGPGQLPLSQITILSPRPFKASSAARLPKALSCHILALDAWAIRNFPPQAISFARIHEFKGLENEAVLVVDLPAPESMDHGSTGLAAHYVAMSRARSILSLIYTA
ncbi:MAG: nuclease, partial [Desulfobacterales bacterium]